MWGKPAQILYSLLRVPETVGIRQVRRIVDRCVEEDESTWIFSMRIRRGDERLRDGHQRPTDRHRQAALLSGLSSCCLPERLSGFDAPTWTRPPVPSVRFDPQHPVVPIAHERAGGPIAIINSLPVRILEVAIIEDDALV